MPASVRRVPVTAILVAAFVVTGGPALAARYTDHLDGIEAEVAERDGALPGSLDRAQTKARKAYAKTQALLAGDTTDLAGEIRVASQVAKTLEKGVPGDGELEEVLATAADDLAEDAASFLEDLDAEVADDADSRGKTKALRALDAAGNYLESSDGETLTFLRLRLMGKAVKKTVPVVRYTGGGGGGGGGGGEGCWPETRTLLPGESCTASWTAASFTAGAVSVRLIPAGPTTRKVGSFYQCTPDQIRNLSVVVFGSVEVGTTYFFDQVSGVASVFYGAGAPDGLLASYNGFGKITFTEVDPATGTYAGTFELTTTTGGVAITDGAFRFTGAK